MADRIVESRFNRYTAMIGSAIDCWCCFIVAFGIVGLCILLPLTVFDSALERTTCRSIEREHIQTRCSTSGGGTTVPCTKCHTRVAYNVQKHDRAIRYRAWLNKYDADEYRYCIGVNSTFSCYYDTNSPKRVFRHDIGDNLALWIMFWLVLVGCIVIPLSFICWTTIGSGLLLIFRNFIREWWSNRRRPPPELPA